MAWRRHRLECPQRRLIRDGRLETRSRPAQHLGAYTPYRLDKLAGTETKTTYADLITGIVLHDTYHVGQIQMLKRLWKSTN